MTKKKPIILISIALLLIPAFQFRTLLARQQADASQERVTSTTDRLPGLHRSATVVRDKFGVPHVTASSEHDAYFMMGYLQAEDRFFQMDTLRRQGSGKLSELLGAGQQDSVLSTDLFIRTVGMRRSAERSLSAYSPEAAGLIQAYADGVNAWLDNNSLPPEYQALEITQVPRWTPVDSLTISKLNTFLLSFDIGDLENTVFLSSFQAAGEAGGFDGSKLYFEDTFRFSPFDPVVTVPRSPGETVGSLQGIRSLNIQSQMIENARPAQATVPQSVLDSARRFIDQYKKTPLSNRKQMGFGSNWWLVAGSKTATGNAMLANDPHLGLGAPASFYEIHLTVNGHSSPMNVYGVSLPGIPGILLGHNDRISWGVTLSNVDITDFYTESVVSANGAPQATNFRGRIEPLNVIPEEYRINQVQNGVADDIAVVVPGTQPSGLFVPPATFIVPRRNNGPLVPASDIGAFSMQFAGNSATRELEGLFALGRSRNLNDFKRALQFIEVGSLNWGYTDIDDNIAFFVNGKAPLREDLQAGRVEGLPPFFLRDGTGTLRHEWIPRSGPGFNYESLSFEEMPHAVNPAQGFLVNANNDPVGIMLDNDPLNQLRDDGGIYYLSSEFSPGFRAAKITQLLNQQFSKNHGRGKVTLRDLQRIQSNVQMLDAEVFVPYIIRAFNTARGAGAPAELSALANDRAIVEAVGRLSNWDFSAPTGIPEGYDANDTSGFRRRPSQSEVSNSVASTIYNIWRSQIVANTLFATLERLGLDGEPKSDKTMASLRFLFDNFSTNQGVGASGVDFFEISGVNAPPDVRRDMIILNSLKGALNLLAGDAFADAFGRSTDQDDYRWGKLHRVTLEHAFGRLAPQFSIPSAGGFMDLSPALPGLAADGGFETIDVGTYLVTGASSREFTFSIGPARRYVAELSRHGIRSEQIIPGGESGVIGNRFFSNQLSSWLTNEYHPVLFTDNEIDCNRFSKVVYRPAN
jgi:penicillin G amidase